jgi:intein/homing endonuclease
VCDRDKVIPDLIFGLRKEKLRLYLNRLFTCDGTPEPSGLICYRSASIQVVRQVQHLLARFGIASVVGDPGRDAGSAAAALWIDRKPDVVRFIDQIGFLGDKAIQAEFIRAALYDIREADAPRDRIGPVLFDRVVSIEETQIAPVYDLTIEGSHNFIANDFVVHNDGRWRP